MHIKYCCVSFSLCVSVSIHICINALDVRRGLCKKCGQKKRERRDRTWRHSNRITLTMAARAKQISVAASLFLGEHSSCTMFLTFYTQKYFYHHTTSNRLHSQMFCIAQNKISWTPCKSPSHSRPLQQMSAPSDPFVAPYSLDIIRKKEVV